jgi:Pvc16 N-terminal domain/IPT/TIG domain
MPFADTGKAIGAVSKVLKDYLYDRVHTLQLVLSDSVSNITIGPGSDVTVGRPETLSGNGGTIPRLNLFLYEIQFDPNLRNYELDTGQNPPLWLVLKYVLTAFDESGNSESIGAHMLLGEGVRALQSASFLQLGSTASILSTLNDNPEELKLTFDQTPPDLLSKLMQGPDDKYRCSVSFEIRPVMIVPSEPISYTLLVGINYQEGNIIRDDKGIMVDVLPSLGPTIDSLSPTTLEASLTSTLTLRGNDLNLSGLAVKFGTVELPITAQTPTSVACNVNGTLLDGRLISAGSHPVSVVQVLPSGKRRSSNLLVANLLPILDSVTVSNITRVEPANLNSNVYATLDIQGSLLGTVEDDIFLALYRDGKTVKFFDDLTIIPTSPPLPPTPLQKQLRFAMQASQAVPPGQYRVILRVNGQQAKNSPVINLILP